MISKETPRKISALIYSILENNIKLQKGSRLVDGKGSKRVADEILKI